jgi:hypothetical protein
MGILDNMEGPIKVVRVIGDVQADSNSLMVLRGKAE